MIRNICGRFGFLPLVITFHATAGAVVTAGAANDHASPVGAIGCGDDGSGEELACAAPRRPSANVMAHEGWLGGSSVAAGGRLLGEHLLLQVSNREAFLAAGGLGHKLEVNGSQGPGIERSTARTKDTPCCDYCARKPFCSPYSRQCYDSKAKDYYMSCASRPSRPTAPPPVRHGSHCGVICQPEHVRRRRRESSCSCRRRSGAAELTPGWTCSGDVIKPCDVKNGECKVGVGHWCETSVPEASWNLSTCTGRGNMRVKALTYNLYWWHLFGVRQGAGMSAGRLIRANALGDPFDVAAFQECDDPDRILRDAAMKESYHYVRWGSNTIAYRKPRWYRMAQGDGEFLAEDQDRKWKRGVHWVRLHDGDSGRTLFVMNHHGPLPINSGGVCGGAATAYNMLKVMARHSGPSDALLLVGDFNADSSSPTVHTIQGRMYHVMENWVDSIFSNCAGSAIEETKLLGKGGSDHNALMAIFRF